MSMAFATPTILRGRLQDRLPINDARCPRRDMHHRYRNPASMTSLPAGSQKPTESSNPAASRPLPPLPPPDFVTSNDLASTLYTLFSTRADVSETLSQVMTNDIAWSMPLFDAKSLEKVTEAFESFFSFAIEPTIVIYSLTTDPEQPTKMTFEWTISFIHPLPWRPRVTLSGTSKATTTPDGRFVTSITDTWSVSPFALVRQTLPTFSDIVWLWPAPHAETDIGTRRILQKAKTYTIVEQAPRAEFHAVGNLQQNERELVYATPAFPPDCFEGGLRRKEMYSTVSPLSIRELSDDMYEWTVALPSGHVGSSDVLAQAPLAEGVSLETMGRRVFATLRFNGFSSREITEGKLAPFVQALRDDGWWDGEIFGQDVYVRLYDVKVGFNSSGLLAMCMYGFLRWFPRVNEIAIDITEAWHKRQR